MTENNFNFSTDFPFASPPSNEELLRMLKQQTDSCSPDEINLDNMSLPPSEDWRSPTEIDLASFGRTPNNSPLLPPRRRTAHAVEQPNATESGPGKRRNTFPT